MPKFVSPKDVAFFNGINLELMDEVVETSVIMYSLIPEKQNPNIYGESTEKVFEPGVKANALINHEDEITEDDEFGPNVQQRVQFAFHRDSMKTKDYYPERGDIIKYYNAYFEVTHIIDNQLLAGREELPFSIVVIGIMVNKSSINVRGEK